MHILLIKRLIFFKDACLLKKKLHHSKQFCSNIHKQFQDYIFAELGYVVIEKAIGQGANWFVPVTRVRLIKSLQVLCRSCQC